MLWRSCAVSSPCEPSWRGGRSAAIRRNRAWNSSFVARSNSLYKIYLMIAFVSSHGHRGLLATEERRRRLAEAGFRRTPHLQQSRRGASSARSRRSMDANGEGWNYSEREERGVSFREGLGGSGVPGGPYSPALLHSPKTPWVSAIRYLSSRVVRANRLARSVGSCSGGLMDPASKSSSTGVAYRNVRIVSSAELGSQLRRQIGLS
jgi:hypothetical protein